MVESAAAEAESIAVAAIAAIAAIAATIVAAEAESRIHRRRRIAAAHPAASVAA